jgi:predicted nuclease of restriction endonuclease-like (RecB) superfamily
VVPSRRPSNTAGSPDVLVLQIKSGLHEREGKALTNFPRALPPPDSDMAEQILKDPYNFDFLTVTATAREREIERGLLTQLRDLLLELGRGFSFVGSQVPVTVDEQTFYIDLLFYHVRLHRYFVFDLLCGAPHKSSNATRQLRPRWKKSKSSAKSRSLTCKGYCEPTKQKSQPNSIKNSLSFSRRARCRSASAWRCGRPRNSTV